MPYGLTRKQIDSDLSAKTPEGKRYAGYVKGSKGIAPVYSDRLGLGGARKRPTTPSVVQPENVDTSTPATKPVLTEKPASIYPSGDGMQSRSRRSLNRYSGMANKLNNLGNKAMRDYTQVYQPGIRRLSDTAEMPVQDLIDRASIDTNMSYDKSRGIMNRNASRMGINPNSGRFQGLQQQWGLARAAAEAGAMTRAGRTGREDNFRRLLDAVGMSKGASGRAESAFGGAANIHKGASEQYDDWATEQGALSGFNDGGSANSSWQDDIQQDWR